MVCRAPGLWSYVFQGLGYRSQMSSKHTDASNDRGRSGLVWFAVKWLVECGGSLTLLSKESSAASERGGAFLKALKAKHLGCA